MNNSIKSEIITFHQSGVIPFLRLYIESGEIKRLEVSHTAKTIYLEGDEIFKFIEFVKELDLVLSERSD